jgi:hypothetical protein
LASTTVPNTLRKSFSNQSLASVYNARAESSAPVTSIRQTLRRKSNETYTQGIAAVGRFGRYFRVCVHAENFGSAWPHSVVPASALRVVVAVRIKLRRSNITNSASAFFPRLVLQSQPYFVSDFFSSLFAPASCCPPPSFLSGSSSISLVMYCTMIETRRLEGSSGSLVLRSRWSAKPRTCET